MAAGGADGCVRRDDPPQQGDHQANGQLAYRMDSVTCRVVKNDTASLARVLIHVIDTGECHADQLETGASFDHRPGKPPVAQQEDISVIHTLDQLGIGQASCVGDKEAMTALFKEISEPGPTPSALDVSVIAAAATASIVRAFIDFMDPPSKCY